MDVTEIYGALASRGTYATASISAGAPETANVHNSLDLKTYTPMLMVPPVKREVSASAVSVSGKLGNPVLGWNDLHTE